MAEGNLAGLSALLHKRAEIFVFAGHGSAAKMDGIDAEVAFELDEDSSGPSFLTQYWLLAGTRLQHNKWTLLNACVSGTGSDEAARAEVSGFLKAFIAAGAGALTVTLWPVRNEAIAKVAGELLRDAAKITNPTPDSVTAHAGVSAKAMDGSAVPSPSKASIDIVVRLREIQLDAYKNWHQQNPGAVRLSDLRPPGSSNEKTMQDAFHACPMVLYL